ncbi:site-specific DNA methylase [Thermanaeromonas toyohensis ToBE]|uniref:Site-specific DNA methylase n=1 Tax=Thermanaeromonas toyohensis ToBE TaxID=698762 RepID=A0A1W1VT33_9FIRM|nr:site-specific DNA methylase [Thermanaeromonas toyohensis ToBE]
MLDWRGYFVIPSNSDRRFILHLCESYDIRTVRAKRPINCRADGRGPVAELVIRNYS